MKKISKCLASIMLVAVMSIGSAKADLVVPGTRQAHLDFAFDPMFASTGFVDRIDPVSGEYVFGGSANLINPHWVLMSAHQVTIPYGNQTTGNFGFRAGFGSNYLNNRGDVYTASQVFVHPSFQDIGVGYDLALLYFENPILNVPYASLYDGVVTTGMETYVAGYGLQQDAGNPNSFEMGDRSAGNNVIYEMNGIYATTRLFPSILPEYRVLGSGGRPGDSGGALFINNSIAGITSSASFANLTSGFTDYSLLDRPWIESTISSVPEPSSIFLLSTVLVPMALRRRRKTV